MARVGVITFLGSLDDRDALRAWVKSRFGVSAPEFLKPAQARDAIEQLKAWQKRVRA